MATDSAPPRINHLTIGDRRIYFLHESNSVLRDLLAHGLLDARACVVCTYSWYSDERKFLTFRSMFEDLRKDYPDQYDLLLRRVIFCGNSLSEYQCIRHIIPLEHVIFFNNTAFLSERVFYLGKSEREFTAVMNAKPRMFKRHYLLGDTRDWLLISYKLNNIPPAADFVDLSCVACRELVADIADYKVAPLLNRCHVGVVLSEIEGACYASTEYLLSGLPVVSTASLGGRDVFYSDANCIIVPPEREAIMAAVEDLAARGRAGQIDRAAIRAGTIARMDRFRRTLADAVAACVDLPPDDVFQVLCDNIRQHNKLWQFRSFWLAARTPRPAAPRA